MANLIQLIAQGHYSKDVADQKTRKLAKLYKSLIKLQEAGLDTAYVSAQLQKLESLKTEYHHPDQSQPQVPQP